MACEFVKLANGQLVAVSPDGKKVKNSPTELGCYLLNKDRTDRSLAIVSTLIRNIYSNLMI